MTKRRIENQIDALSDELADGSDGAPADLTVTWREAAPDERPEGLTYDPDASELIYDLWSAQRACLDALERDDTDLVAFLAGYGTGKTVFGARWTIANALAHPGSHFLVMGQTFSKARDSTFQTLFEQLPGERTAVRTGSFNGPEESPLVADYNRSKHRLTLTNDTVITLGSADSWSRFAGAEFGGIWLDEPSHYEADLHELLAMLGSRLRGTAGPKVQCWTLTGNGYNDAWEILEQRQDSTGEPLGLGIELVRASTLDNPYLDAGDIERFERQFAETDRAEQALHGGFAAAQGLVYSSFRREDHVIPHSEALERVEGDWRIYGYDAGWDDPRVLLELGQTDYGQLVVLDEFYRTASHVDDAIGWLQTKPRGHVFAEHEPADIKKFRQADYRAGTAAKSVNPGIADVRHRLERDTEARVGLLVADRCEHLIREFLGYKAEHVGASSADDHCLDALRYAIHTARERQVAPSSSGTAGSTSTAGAQSEVDTAGSERARRRDRHRGRFKSTSRRR